MSAPYKASFALAPSNTSILPGSLCNDLLIWTGNSNQNILFGVSNVNTYMSVSGSGNMSLSGNVAFSNQLQLSGIMLTQRTSAFTNNVTSSITSLQGFAYVNGDIQITMSNVQSNAIRFLQNSTEYMRVSSNGFVGIGTTIPTAPLTVIGTGNGGGGTPIAYFLNSTGPPLIEIGSAINSNLYINYYSNLNYSQLGIYNGSSTLNITNSNIGINTSTPLSKFTIKNGYSEGVSGGLCIDATDGGAYNMVLASYLQGGAQVGYRFTVNNLASTASNVLCLGYNGYIGLGTSNPYYGLHLSSTSVGGVQLLYSMSNQPADGKHWGWGPNGTSFYGFTMSDAFVSANWLQVTRSANTISTVAFPNGTISTTGSILGGGGDNTFIGCYVGIANLGFVKKFGQSTVIGYNNGNPFKISMLSQADVSTGISTATFTDRLVIDNSGTVTISGALSKGSGTFDIQHPLSTDSNNRLVHSFIEGPRCDLIYRGTTNLVNGKAIVNLDKDCVAKPESAMQEGTFEALCANPVKYLHNNDSFDRVIGKITGNLLTITCKNTNSVDSIDWMVIAERKDPFIKTWNRTNQDGYLITEYTLSNI
jgi:hypothetical protein